MNHKTNPVCMVFPLSTKFHLSFQLFTVFISLLELYKCLQNIEKDTKTQVEREQSAEVTAVLQKKLKDIRKDIASINAKLKTPTEKKSNQTAINARRYEEIIVNCTKELMADRNSSSAYFERAKAHQALGKLDNAEKDYRDGLRFSF